MLLLKKYENTYTIQKCDCVFGCLHLCVCSGGGNFSFMDDLMLQNSSLHMCFANALECSDQHSGRAWFGSQQTGQISMCWRFCIFRHTHKQKHA